MRSADRHPRLLRVAVGLAVLWVLGLIGALVLAGLLGSEGCSAGELAVLKEIPQYDGREIEPGPVGPSASCYVRYPANAPKEEILAYYSERLSENSWRMEPQEAPIPHAGRDGYHYRVEFRGRLTEVPEGMTSIEDLVMVRVVEE